VALLHQLLILSKTVEQLGHASEFQDTEDRGKSDSTIKRKFIKKRRIQIQNEQISTKQA
jgi:hypothetical protein